MNVRWLKTGCVLEESIGGAQQLIKHMKHTRHAATKTQQATYVPGDR